MTEIIQDNIDVDMQIGTESIPESGFSDRTEDSFNDDAIFWDVVEAEVELSQVTSPNYVKGRIIPKPQFTDALEDIINEPIGQTDAPDDATDDGNSPNNGWSNIVGARFRLEVDTDFSVSRIDDTTTVNRSPPSENSDNSEKEGLLFDGRLANISPIGTGMYKFEAYDPSHQEFITEDSGDSGDKTGSIMNQVVKLTGTTSEFYDPESAPDNESGNYSKKAIDIVFDIIEEANIGSSNSEVQDSAFKDSDGDYIRVQFNKLFVPVEKAFKRICQATNTEWWFNKSGTLYVGDPRTDFGGGVSVYNLEFIKDTSAGITTPPYQSVRVIGSGVASSEGWVGNAKIQDEENRIIKEANIGRPTGTLEFDEFQGDLPGEDLGTEQDLFPDSLSEEEDVVIDIDPEGELNEPTFKHINAQIATAEHAENTARTIADKLIKQQGSGTVTVVGLPEVEPFDGIRMPNSSKQPMGGQLYDVYSVMHKLNPSDGFVTEITVAGPNPAQVRGTVYTGGENREDIVVVGDNNSSFDAGNDGANLSNANNNDGDDGVRDFNDLLLALAAPFGTAALDDRRNDDNDGDN